MRQLYALLTLLSVLASQLLWGQTAPAPFNLGNGNYYFTEWSTAASAGTYPTSMRFHTCDTFDPTVTDTFDMDYTTTYQSHSSLRVFAGLNTDGISMQNSGNNTNLNPKAGQVVLSLNTSGRTNIQVSWVGKQLNPGNALNNINRRVVAIRLQYYVGPQAGIAYGSNWIDASSTLSDIEFESQAPNNYTKTFAPITLPTACENKDTVYLRWVYILKSGTAGNTRPRLALDDIAITSSASPWASGVVLPHYMQGDSAPNTTRLPLYFNATISNLAPNTTYRVYPSLISASIPNRALDGSATPIITDSISNFTLASSSEPDLSTSGNYYSITTGAGGNYTGWFGALPVRATFMAPGTGVKVHFVINNGSGGTTKTWHATIPDSITVLNFGTSASVAQGSAIYGYSNATDKDFVLAYDNENGFGRPLTVACIENNGLTETSNYATFYADSVDGFSGRWGAIIPNLNANGIRRLISRRIVDNSVGCFYTDADGTWPTNSVATASPTNGTSPLIIDSTDAEFVCGACTPPTTQTSALTGTVGNPSKSSINLSWTRGNGTGGVIILAKTALISETPVSGTIYPNPAGDFEVGTQVGGAKVVYVGTGTDIMVTNLDSNRTYYFAAFEYNTSGTCFLTTDPDTTRVNTLIGVVAPENLTRVSNNTTQANISWDKPLGNHLTDWDGVVVFMSTSSNINPTLTNVDGSAWTGSTTYGSGTTITDGYAVANQTTDNNGDITVTNLSASTTYYVRAFTYRVVPGSNNDEWSPASDEISFSTVVQNVLNVSTSSNTDSTITISWTNPAVSTGTFFDEILVVGREFIATSVTPIGNGSNYTANANFYTAGNDGNLSVGQRAVYKGSGNTITVTNLYPGAPYHFTIFTRLGTSWSSGTTLLDSANGQITYYSTGSGDIATPVFTPIPGGSTSKIPDMTSNTNLVIQNTHAITYSTTFNCKNITVDLGGQFSRGATNVTYFNFYGNLVVNGTFGDISTNDGISLDLVGENQIVSGSGTIRINRARKSAIATTYSTSTFTIDADMTFTGNNVNCFTNNRNSTNFNIVINSGKTVSHNVTNGYFSMDGTHGSATNYFVGNANQRGGTLTVNGLFIVSNRVVVGNNNTNVDYPTAVIINNGGEIRTRAVEFYGEKQGIAGASLIINNGGKLTFTDAPTITGTADSNFVRLGDAVNTTFTNNGTVEYAFSTTGNVVYTPNTINNLILNGSNNIELTQATTLNGTLTFTNGNLRLGSNNLTLSSSSTVGDGNTNSYIQVNGTGRVLRTIPNGTSFTFPIGFNPYLALTVEVPSGQPDATWTVGVSDGITDPSGNPETLNAVNYTWDVISSSAVDRPVFTPQWPGSAEASNFSTYRSDARVIMRQGTSGTWFKQITTQTPGVSGSDPYTVSSWGFDDFPASTLYQIGVTHNSSLVVNPLPVEFISFEAEKSLNNVNLTWATAWELNNQGFHVEYSIDGSNWTELEFVAGNGTINSVSRYQTIHRNVNAFGANVLYYRLRQIDFDGTTAFSPVRIVRLNGRTNEGINIRYTADAPVLHYSASQSSKINLRLMSLSGKEVYNSNRTLSAGENLIELPIINPSCIYLLEINNGDNIFIEKVKY
jgi:hypothetical protein